MNARYARGERRQRGPVSAEGRAGRRGMTGWNGFAVSSAVPAAHAAECCGAAPYSHKRSEPPPTRTGAMKHPPDGDGGLAADREGLAWQIGVRS
jgi:hypothetical protein